MVKITHTNNVANDNVLKRTRDRRTYSEVFTGKSPCVFKVLSKRVWFFGLTVDAISFLSNFTHAV